MFLLLRMLGPQMCLQLVLTDKMLGQAAQRLVPAVTAHARSSFVPAACPSWQICADRPRSAMPQHNSESALSFLQPLLRMLGPHVRQQLVLPGKDARTGRAAPCRNTRASQLSPSFDRHCACLVLMCASSLSFLAKVRGQAAQRHASALECVNSWRRSRSMVLKSLPHVGQGMSARVRCTCEYSNEEKYSSGSALLIHSSELRPFKFQVSK